MTLSTTTQRKDYVATAGQTTFAYDFLILVNTDLKVYVNGVLKTITTDYTVTGVGSGSGGAVIFGSGLTLADVVAIIRDTPMTQETDYITNDKFPSAAHETALDKLTMICQDLHASNNPITTAGDLITGDAGGISQRLAAGAEGDRLTILPTTGLVGWVGLKSTAARVVITAATQVIPADTWTKVTLDSERFDYGDNFNSTLYRYVLPATGVYLVSALIQKTDTLSRVHKLAIYINGVVGRQIDGQQQVLTLVTMIAQSAGVYLELYSYAELGQSIYGGLYSTCFEVIRIA